MLTRLVFLVCLALVVAVFLTGAWPGPTAVSSSSAEPGFVAQAVSLDESTLTSGVDGKQLLRKAADAISWRNARWLKTKIRQTIVGPESNSTMEGFLQRGPNHCARLEMNAISAERFARVTFVSDGRVIALDNQTSQDAAKALVEHLVEETAEPRDDAEAKEESLDRKGCGGPGPLLKRIHHAVRNVRTQTGTLAGKVVFRITSDVAPEAAPAVATPIACCQVFLDAKSLWPWRVEWLTADSTGTRRVVARIDFLEPEINQELTESECKSMFSYQPK